MPRHLRNLSLLIFLFPSLAYAHPSAGYMLVISAYWLTGITAVLLSIIVGLKFIFKAAVRLKICGIALLFTVIAPTFDEFYDYEFYEDEYREIALGLNPFDYLHGCMKVGVFSFILVAIIIWKRELTLRYVFIFLGVLSSQVYIWPLVLEHW